MKVRSLRQHANAYGDNYEKPIGKVYEVPDDQTAVLIDNGFVEPAKAEKLDK